MPRWTMFLLFFLVATVVVGASHVYVFRRARTVFALGERPRWRRALVAVLVFLGLSYPLSRLVLHTAYNGLSCAYFYLASVWLGVFLYLFLGTLFAHGLGLLLRVLRVESRLDRKGRLQKSLLCLGWSATVLLSVWGLFEARREACVTEIRLPVSGLPAELDGFVIVQITDVHVGAIIGAERLERIVQQVNRLKPDLVVITGDLVDQDAERFNAVKAPLDHLISPNGVYAVVGNHEFFSDVDAAVLHARRAGIHFLRNEKTRLANGIWLYGIDDPTGARMGYPVPGFEQVIGPEAKQAPAILLYHQPRNFAKAAELGIDLMLSGHTHRGQLWPIRYITALVYEHYDGLYRSGDSTLYVSRGIGTWGPPMRVGAPPELVKLILVPREGSEGPELVSTPAR